MDCEFYIQDPTSSETIYLFEAIIDALRGASTCEGMFAFASRAGVESLIGDPETQKFLCDSQMSLLVGIDAVTNRDTLVRLQELEQENERLNVRVFMNPTDALFHPKVARFEYCDGRRLIIVGSGNLTPGGLRQNFEAFSVLQASANETLDISSWDRFLVDHAHDLRAIDEPALERAARNTVRGRRRPRDIEVRAGVPVENQPAGEELEVPVGRTDRLLIAEVPKAGDRWNQVHFNLQVIDEFFRVKQNTSQRVYLHECRQDRTFGEQEVRPCVYSESNKNSKIEIASHHGMPYPNEGRPIAVFRELQTRSFAYMLLMPGYTGYDKMLELNEKLPLVGEGLRRVYAKSADIASIWPDCPLITAVDELSKNG